MTELVEACLAARFWTAKGLDLSDLPAADCGDRWSSDALWTAAAAAQQIDHAGFRDVCERWIADVAAADLGKNDVAPLTQKCDALFERVFWSVVLHELSHVISNGYLSSDDRQLEPELSEHMKRAFVAGADSPPESMPSIDGNHDRRFVRAACHLAYRAVRDNYGWLDFDTLLQREQFGIDTKLFRDALQRECRKLVNTPIREILDTAEPQNFRRIWDFIENKREGVNAG